MASTGNNKGKGKTKAAQTASSTGSDAASGAKTSRREERRVKREKQKRQRQILQLGAAVVILVGAAAAAFWPRSQATGVTGERVLLDPAIGPESAAVTIVEFADFGCPSCRAWHNSGVRERVLERYGEQVRFVWKDFPVITAFSPQAAEAGQCALDQGQDAFWAYHDLVFARGDLRRSSLIAYSDELAQVERATFESCLQSGRHETTVAQDMNDARNLRLRGTPSFVVNGQVLAGPPRFEQLSVLIDNALAANP